MPTFWRRRRWPPSPSVEDEADSLAHEIPTGGTEYPKSDEEAKSRGTVNQYPIILDIDEAKSAGAEPPDVRRPPNFDSSSVASQSSEDSYGPATPQNVRYAPDEKDKRGPQIPSTKDKEVSREEKQATSKAEKREERPRGRPNVAKIDTGLGGDLQGMISGQRRAPSPYAFTKPEPTDEHKLANRNRFSGDTFLSPDAATPKNHISTLDSKRSSSTRRERPDEHGSSTESDHHRHRHKHRHHSRHRSARESYSGRDTSTEREHKETKMHHHGRHRDRSHQRAGPDSQTADHLDEHTSKRHHRHFHHERHGSKPDSPHTSSAEDSKGRYKNQDHLNVANDSKPRRHSRSRPQRPVLDPSFLHYSPDDADVTRKNDDERRHGVDRAADSNAKPSSDQTRRHQTVEASSVGSKAMEDYFESAFHHNKRNTHPSPHPSPLGSPQESPNNSGPNTPPRTPRPTDSSFSNNYGRNPVTQGQAGASKPKAPSRASSIDVPHSTVPAPQKSSRPSSLLSKSSRSSSEAHYTSNLNSATNIMKSKYSSPLPSPIDHPPLQRSGSYAFPVGPNHPSTQRSFSYSNNDGHRPLSEEAHRLSSYHSPDLQFTPVNSSSPTTLRMSRSSAHSSQEKVPRLPPFSPAAIDLPKCPRSTPTAGYHDWYSISDLPQLDVCPTCMKSIGNSRFRDLFVPSLPKGRDEMISCSLSDPWIRAAWIQTIKQRQPNLDMLHQILNKPLKTLQCPGKGMEARKWFRLIDPENREPVHGFAACTDCVRRVDIVFPQLKKMFLRITDLVQERKCDLECSSHRFDKYMELLDDATTEYKNTHLSTPDIAAFVEHANRMARLRECNRDNMVIAAGWHFHPDLPELTICEECYDAIVWPLRDKPIARDVTSSLSLVPGNRHDSGLSCQLYSQRMRTKFEEAVWNNDFRALRDSAVRRYTAERRLQERQALLIDDVKRGYNRHADLQHNIKLWKQIE